MNEISLSCLRTGDAAVVQAVHVYGGMRRRLRDLGLLPGSKIVCSRIAPSGSPMAFRLNGAMIALRVETCKRIRVKLCE